MNRTNTFLFLISLLSTLSLAPVVAQPGDANVVPLRGPAADSNASTTTATPAPAAAQTTSAQNPLDDGHPATNAATPITDSLGKPSTSPAAARQQSLSANFSTVSATAKLLDNAPLMRCRDDNMKFVEITLRNDSSEVALVHGDIAEAKVGDRMRTAASARYIGTVAKPKLNTKGRVYTGLVLAGSWGLAGPIFYELVTPDQHAKRYLGTAVGVDGSRHEIEDQRFGLRVLMPGEETVGWLAFECPTANDLTSLLIPVNYSKSTLPSGSLFVPVKAADAKSAEVKPAASPSAPPASSSVAPTISAPASIPAPPPVVTPAAPAGQPTLR